MANYKIGAIFEQKNYEEMASSQMTGGDGFVTVTSPQYTLSCCITWTIPSIKLTV
ncbi:hypothetical protein [Clostridium cellulovorans]|uniref:Uncharacterized protein n=1 Tax=Clostridium cellulovorans (strain ATCC 35296 / DSM 3052 / OCM 3 / 743B) TaxID=573061 RepID=D9ST32_CLOC7|nr:hypothetical protein [Clostridium cellulovorans]ADL50648.1 hypothetical protein Clocel_0878 [Clostridium cellulovorans 743B]